jgi:uncharacterized membrane protein YfcA
MKNLTDRSGRQFQYRFSFKSPDSLAAGIGGAFVGLTGVGVGEIVTTLLAVRHRFPLHLATATSVFVVAITVLTAALTHSYFLFEGNLGLPWNLVVVMVVAVSVGGQIAPRLAGKVPEWFLKKALITMFLLVGSVMVWRAFV